MPTLIVDGYNIIHQWPLLKKEAEDISWECARNRLISILAEYQSYTGNKVILVFDGYLTERGSASKSEELGIEVVFTSKKQTADSFIERFVYQNRGSGTFLVATSDVKIERIIVGLDAWPISPQRLKEMIERTKEEWQAFCH